MEPSIEFSWNCTSRLPYFYFYCYSAHAWDINESKYRRFSQQATKKRKKDDSQKQPSKLKEYAAVKIVGRRTSNNTPRSQMWSSQSYIFCLVGWVEACLTADLPSILQLSFLRTFVVVLVSCLDSAVFMEYSLDPPIIWGGWTFGGRVKVMFANWVHFQTSYFFKAAEFRRWF